MTQGQNTQLITVFGVGGVGKTTCSAALGLSLACKGKRVAVVTVDPAKRLANIMGIQSLSSKPQRVFDGFLSQSTGSLSALWIDSANVLEDIIRYHKEKFKDPDSIIQNRLFKILQSQLGGIEEYLGLEKIIELKQSGEFDVCILDTPPSKQGLDYLEAPKHLLNFLDEGVLGFFMQTPLSSGQSGLKNIFSRILGYGSEGLLLSFRKFLGDGFLTELAELLTTLSPLRSIFLKTADNSLAWFKSPDTQYALVSSQDPYPFEEIKRIEAALKLKISGARSHYIFNRCLPNIAPFLKELSNSATDAEKWLDGRFRQQIQTLPNISSYVPYISQNNLGVDSIKFIGDKILENWSIEP
jgi:anion-transporting  ArsA/GET3 family ATPase